MWEKYSSEIGTQDGPLRHVDENSQYPHLNGFVAFDMEHWWAERSISCMMNEKPMMAITDDERTYLKNNNDFFRSTSLNKTSNNFKLSSNGPKSAKLNSISPLQSLNNFQLCFS